MDENKREELISAYLDGELDAAEHERTAKWIEEDPRAQNLLQELQGLQTAMRELPRHRLENNLTQPVLEQIDAQPAAALYSMAAADIQPENIMYATAPAQHTLSEPAAIGHANFELEKPLDHDRRRLYLWPAVAIAVAVLLMVFSSRDPVEEDRSVARSDLGVGQESAASQEATTRPPSTAAIESKPQFKLQSAEPRSQRRMSLAKTNDLAGSSLAERVAPAAEAGEASEFNEPLAFADQDSQASASETTPLRTTYLFNASPEIDIKSQLETLSRESSEVKVIDLGTAPHDASSSAVAAADYRVFDLYGDPEATYTMIEALKNVSGLTFSTRKRLRSDDFPIKSEKNKRAGTKIERLEKNQVFAQPAPDCIRLIIIVPTSRSQSPKR